MTHLPIHAALASARARGVSMLTAVFLLVVLAGLAAAIVGVFSNQQSAAVLDVLGVRADQAARSGLDWGLYRQLRLQAPTGSVACFAPSPVTFALPADSVLASFSVTVTCTPGTNVVGNTTNRWTISAVACNKPVAGSCLNASQDADYVRRRVQAELN